METKKYNGPSIEWLEKTDAIAATCLSVAAAGLAADCGMIDRELLAMSHATPEAILTASVTAPVE